MMYCFFVSMFHAGGVWIRVSKMLRPDLNSINSDPQQWVYSCLCSYVKEVNYQYISVVECFFPSIIPNMSMRWKYFWRDLNWLTPQQLELIFFVGPYPLHYSMVTFSWSLSIMFWLINDFPLSWLDTYRIAQLLHL